MPSYDELKDAKIAEILSDYLELEKKINELPSQISSSIESIHETIKLLPNELELSLNKIFVALEEAEKTSKSLVANAKIETTSHAHDEIESAKQCIAETIKKAINDNIAEPLAMSKSEIYKINDELRNGSGTVSKTGWLAIILLIFSTTLFAFLAIYINFANSSLQKENVELQRKWAVERQERIKHFEVLERLPKTVQSQYNIESKKYERSINQKLTN